MHKTLIVVLATLATLPAHSATCVRPLAGINLAGAEFAPSIVPGRVNWDYKFPTEKHISYYRSMGFSHIRLPITWERIQPNLFSKLSPEYLNGILTVLDAAEKYDMKVVIDVHNYGKYKGSYIGTAPVPPSAFADLWTKIAQATSKHAALHGYGLMNEPNGSANAWHKVAQYGVDGIRKADKSKYIYVAGESYSNMERWATINPKPFVSDPANKEVYEAHLYLDKDTSGKYTSTAPYASPALIVQARSRSFLEWLNRFNKTGMIGEWGVPTDDSRWLSAAQAIFSLSTSNCIQHYVWAGGPWSQTYKLSMEPYTTGKDKALASTLRLLLQSNP